MQKRDEHKWEEKNPKHSLVTSTFAFEEKKNLPTLREAAETRKKESQKKWEMGSDEF